MPYRVPLERSLEWKSLPEDARLSGFLGVVVNPVACRASLSDWARRNIKRKIIFTQIVHFVYSLRWIIILLDVNIRLQHRCYFAPTRLNMLKWLIYSYEQLIDNVYFSPQYTQMTGDWIMLLPHPVSHAHCTHTSFPCRNTLKALVKSAAPTGCCRS